MTEEQDYKTVEAMEKYGGSFVQALSVCFRKADPINFMKLRLAFSEYWKQYESMAEKY